MTILKDKMEWQGIPHSIGKGIKPIVFASGWEFAVDGGEGSGNFHHHGRPGMVGGSAPSGGGSSGGGSENAESEIEGLKSQISKLSRFGKAGEQRRELQKKLDELEGKNKEPVIHKQKVQNQNTKYQVPETNYPVTPHKEKQFEIIQKTNPMHDDIHTGIRKPSDIMSPEEAFGDKEGYVYPDFTEVDGKKALETGEVTIYSSHPIENGGFVTPSKMMAGDYAGEGKIYSKKVPLNSVAWINAGEGQFADVGTIEGSSVEKSAYQKKVSVMRDKAQKWTPNHKAYFMFKQGLMTEEDAYNAGEDGTIDKYLNKYFDALESNGDPEPTKPLRNQVSLYNEVEKEKKHGGDYIQARKDYIKDWTGCSDEEAKETLNQFQTWFGGRWTSADTDTIDSYIDKDGAYDGEIYRGMKFTEDEYKQFMDGLEPGARIGMKGFNASWTTDKETAVGFSHGRDRSVVIKCIGNKTSAPVAHLSTQGEDEVISHSKAQWTVLGVAEGNHRTEITVIESSHRMSDSEREKRRNSEFGGVVHDSETSQGERMNQQNKYFGVVNDYAVDGGKGSGNFHHRGRPGMVGGSGGGGSSSSGSGSSDVCKGFHAPHMQASPKYQKQLDDELDKFPKMSQKEKMEILVKDEILAPWLLDGTQKDIDNNWLMNMRNSGYDIPDDMSFDDACQYALERYTVMEKYTNAHGERKYPLKNMEGTGGYIRTHQQRLKAVQYYTGVDKGLAEKMLNGIENHCGNSEAECEWVDKYIDADGRYDGPIYRWKGYTGKEAQDKLASLYPGAKIGSKYESNWSFSSDPFATSVFGSLRQDDYTTFCFVCDRNITAAPISQYSVYEDEYEVVPHSKTTYTVQSISQKEHDGHKYWEVKISEDDWQKDRDIEPYDPPRESKKHDRKYDWWNL